jgi:hypothetical protein
MNIHCISVMTFNMWKITDSPGWQNEGNIYWNSKLFDIMVFCFCYQLVETKEMWLDAFLLRFVHTLFVCMMKWNLMLHKRKNYFLFQYKTKNPERTLNEIQIVWNIDQFISITEEFFLFCHENDWRNKYYLKDLFFVSSRVSSTEFIIL